MSEWNEKVIAEFRANGGRVGGSFEGVPLVLLTTTGARSGTPRTTPVTYLRDGDRIVVFASNAGAARHPDWYHNLLANREVTVEIGDGNGGITTYPAAPLPLRGAERDRIYARQAELVPVFAEYQDKTTRVIPVVALHPEDPARARAIGDELVRIHDRLRQELATLLDDVERHLAGRVPAAGPSADLGSDLGTELRAHCLSFCVALQAHHDNEEQRGLPLLEQRFPELRPALDRIRDEHHVVAGIMADLRTTLAAAGTGDPTAVRDELRRLVTELENHFDHEERQLVAALNSLT